MIKTLVVVFLVALSLGAEALQSNLPLDQAARDGNLAEVKRLIAVGADPNELNKWGYSALTGACTSASSSPMHVEVVRYLLAHGADVNKRVADGTTALNEAAYWGHMATVAVLLKANANVNATKDDGFTPLIAAAAGGHVDIVRLLLAAGADPNRQTRTGNTALHIASARGHPAIVKLLLAAGGRPDIPNAGGKFYRDVVDSAKDVPVPR